jgi:hypothetical protein
MLFSLSKENVFDRLALADLYQIDSLKYACGKMIRKYRKKLKETNEWIRLKESSPQLVISILEGNKKTHKV